MRKVALIELNSYHGECLYSQLCYLKSANNEVYLFCDKRQEKSVAATCKAADKLIFMDMKKMSSLMALRRYIIDNDINLVIFNTLHGSKVLKFMLLPFPKKISFYGTIHNVRKMKSSFGQKLICRKIKKVFLLADYLKLSFKKVSDIPCESYSPSMVPSATIAPINKNVEEIWAVVPGSIEYKRRDYDALLHLVNVTPNNVKFILLGNSRKGDGLHFVERLRNESSMERFVVFDSFVENELFDAYMEKADYLLPLITENTTIAEEYMTYKVSGTFILSKSYGVPMLIHSDFAKLNGFDYPSHFYSSERQLLQSLQEKSVREKVNFDFVTESRKYLSFISC